MYKQCEMTLGLTISRAVFVIFVLSALVSHSYGVIVYSSDFLRTLRSNDLAVLDTCLSTISDIERLYSEPLERSDHGRSQRSNKKTRNRGRRAGKLVNLRKRNNRLPLPSIILSNVNRLFNKTYELFTRIRSQPDFVNCQVFCFTETWLTPDHPDALVKPDGFSIFRTGRDPDIFGKKKKGGGGGVCFLINDKWCTHIKVISKGCTANLEHLSTKCHPFYLPREFSSVTRFV